MKMFKKYSPKSIGLIILLFLVGIGNIYAEANKKIITIKDAELWRSHSVTLADNGEWYTLLYFLTEKPDPAKENNSAKKDLKKKDKKKKETAVYGKNAQSDVLYIRRADSGKEYRVPKGAKPLFSPASAWIAYSIKNAAKKSDKKDAKGIIELRNLNTGKTRRWKTAAAYEFTRDGNYFVSRDKTSLLLVNLENLQEHYIGNTGEYLLPEKSSLIAYTINTKDRRGNGIYIYNVKTRTTRALETGNYHYANLAWNKGETSLAALKFKKSGEKNADPKDIRIIAVTGAGSEQPELFEYKSVNISGLPGNMHLAVEKPDKSLGIAWAGDNERLFLNLKKNKTPKAAGKGKGQDDAIIDKATIDVWHWMDKKLISQQMIESKTKDKKIYKAVFNRNSKKIIPLTNDKIQRLFRNTDTDQWGIGTDNRAYISDWDVPKNDLYRINLKTGEKKLILKKYDGRIQISPEGEKALFWKDGHYWCYHFKKHSFRNITENVPVSFLNKEYDRYGASPAYGFAGWVNDHKSVIVNHKLDLWQLPLNGKSKAVNLTSRVTLNEAVRFRFDDLNFIKKPEMEERYINLSTPVYLYAFNIKTKYAGFYRLSGNQLNKLIYKPASFSTSRWRWRSALIKAKKAKVIIYKLGSYSRYPESYLSNADFSKSRKITSTNPQQAGYKWGHRVLIEYTNDDGVPLQGILSIPNDYKKGRRLPMIVRSYEKLSGNLYRYAGPRIAGSRTSEMMYVSDGYLFLQPDIHFNIGTPHTDMHECIDAAIQRVIELGYVDEKRIGYEGFSFGGHCGMFISTRKNKFAAIAAGAGVSNLIQGFNIDIVRDGSNEQDYYMVSQGRLGADPTAKLEMYIRESAVFGARNMNTPLLLYHGTADKVVQWEHSFGLYSILRFLKKPVIFLSYREEGHGLRQKANRLDINKRLKEFFDHYLKGEKAPAWLVKGLPYKAKPEPAKKKGKKKEKPKLPMWK